jgi:hypothetical protein
MDVSVPFVASLIWFAHTPSTPMLMLNLTARKHDTATADGGRQPGTQLRPFEEEAPDYGLGT